MLYRTWDPYEVTTLFNTDPDNCLVAHHEGDIVGFALGTIIEKPGALSYGYIIWVGVAEDWRGHHVGQRLLREMEARMVKEGVHMFLVDTSANNHSAIGFFQREGFELSEPHVYLSKTIQTTRFEAAKRKSRRLLSPNLKPSQTVVDEDSIPETQVVTESA